MKKNILFVLSLICLHQAFSQSYQFNRQIKGVELPSNNISGILQDDRGMMWFNTASGIYYSDGFNTYSLPDSIQSQLSAKSNFLKDEDGHIWVYSTFGAPKVFYFSQNQWFEFFFPKAFKAKKHNKLKFSVGGKGSEKVFFLVSDGEISFADMHSKNWVTIEDKLCQSGDFLEIVNDKGSLYLFFEKETFWFVDNNLVPFEFKGLKLPAPIVSARYDEVSGGYFFLGRNYLAYGKTFSQPENIVHQDFSKNIYNLNDHHYLQVNEGKVFYLYNSQLYKFDPVKGNALEVNTDEATKSYFISIAYVAREGIIWIGSSRGLLNLNSLKFLNYDAKILLDDEVTALLKLGPSKYLLGFNNGLEFWENGDLKALNMDKSLVGQPRNRISNFSIDKNGIVWFSSNFAGIGRFDPTNLSVEYSPSPREENINFIKAIGDSLFFVSWSKIYLSSIDHSGDKHYENDITDYFSEKMNQEFSFFRKVDVLKDGRLIFVQVGDLRTQEMVVESDSFVNVIGYNYLESGDSLLLATEMGLMYSHKGKIDFMSFNGEVIKRPVYALLQDSNNNLWVGTDKGVFMVNNGVVRQFDEVNGLAGSEINRGALIEGEDGKIWIGTQKGLSVYDPKEDQNITHSPIVEILGVEILNPDFRDVDLNKIPYSNNSVEIKYRAVSFLQLEHLVIKYKLEGYQDDWHKIENPRSNMLIFNNLPPGEYKLKLQAGLGSQAYSEIITSSTFLILKPFYLQNWFVGLVLLFFLGVGFLLNRFLDQLRKQGILKRTIVQKTREALITEDQFKNVWNSSKDGLMLTLTGGKIITVNPSFSKLVGFSEKELESLNVQDLFSDTHFYSIQKPEFLNLIAASEGKGFTKELRMPFINGQKEVELYATILKSDLEGNSVFLWVIRDIGEKKNYERGLKVAKEKAEEASKVKSNFLSNMSHEIRTPLNGILGTTENIILERKGDQALISQLEIILESGERLLNTINGILDLSRMEANKMRIVYKQTNINDFLGKILLPLKTLAIKKGLLLSAKFETNSLIGMIDRRYFEMIVNNLVGNAIKYSKKGLITVKLKREEDRILLEVMDNGIGMSEDFMSKLFNPFEQESQGYGRTFEGSGLGLTITKNLVELLGGTIQVESVKSKGTSVKVTLPFREF